MKRKTSSKPTRIYSFWCHGPTPETAELFKKQYRAARRFKNKLIEIEQLRRKRRDELVAQVRAVAGTDAQIAECQKKIENLRKAVKSVHIKERSRKTNSTAKNQIAQEKAELKKLYALRKQQAETARNEHAADLKQIDDESYVARKLAYNESDCQWGTKLLVMKAAEQAAKTPTGPQFRKSLRIAPCDPGPTGRIGVQIQSTKPLGKEKLLQRGDTRLRITLADRSLPQTGKRPLGSVEIRLGSDGRKPIWGKMPCKFNREIPDDADIKWAWIKRSKEGQKIRYKLSLVIESETFATRKQAHPYALCALDVGWRKKPEDSHLRFGFLYDGKNCQSYQFDPRLQGALNKAADLQSIRKKKFNTIKTAILSVLSERPEAKEVFKHLDKIKSPQSLYRLFFEWREAGSPGDDLFGLRFNEWRLRENHLYRYESGTRRHVRASRKETYRQTARQLALTYETIVIEKFDLRKVIRRQEAEDKDAEMHDEARSQRFQVAISEFRRELAVQAQKHGSRILGVDAEYSTLTCHHCGFTETWDKIPFIKHTCASCKRTWDQDENAAINLFQKATHKLKNERSSDIQKPGTARKKKNAGLNNTSGAPAAL